MPDFWEWETEHINLLRLPLEILHSYDRQSSTAAYIYLLGLCICCRGLCTEVAYMYVVSKYLFDYTSYFVTVSSSNTVQLQLLGNYPDIVLKLL